MEPDKMVKRIIELSKIESISKSDEETKMNEVFIIIKGYTTDAINLFKNISETSYSEVDFDRRVKDDLCEKFKLTYSNNKFY